MVDDMDFANLSCSLPLMNSWCRFQGMSRCLFPHFTGFLVTSLQLCNSQHKNCIQKVAKELGFCRRLLRTNCKELGDDFKGHAFRLRNLKVDKHKGDQADDCIYAKHTC